MSTIEGEVDKFTEENYNNFSTAEDMSPYSAENQLKLTKALVILHIKPSTFHSYCTSGKYDRAKKLLDNALKERMSIYWTSAYGLRKEKAEVGLPTLKETEIATIHESFQFLNKTYIEKRTKLLSADQMRKNQVRLRKGQEIQIGEGNKSSKEDIDGSTSIATTSYKDVGSSIASRRSIRSAIARLDTPYVAAPSASENGMSPPLSPMSPLMSPTTKLSKQLDGLFTNSGLESDIDPCFMNLATPQELNFMGSKLTRSKSRKSFRKTRTGDQEPYNLLRKGSNKIKAVNSFRKYKASKY